MAACSLQENEAALLVLGSLNSLPEELAAGNPVAMEVKAAQIDGREIELLEARSVEAEMPPGKSAINFDAAEGGPGRDLLPTATEHELLLRNGWRIRTRPSAVESFLARKGILSGARRDPISDEDRRELAGVFRRRRMVPGESSYYMAHLLTLNEREREQADHIVRYFKEHYPGVMIIPLDREKWDEHADRYATLISTVPVRNKMQGN